MEQLTGESCHRDVRTNNRRFLSNRVKIFGIVLLISLIALVFYFIGYNVKAIENRHVSFQYSSIKWKKVLDSEIKCPSSYSGIPPLVLVSLDGFRHDYLSRGMTPTINNISLYGIKVPFIYSVFPTKTFPNHFSIVTGLFPESHGITGNKMIDPDTKKKFTVKNPSEYLNSYWWQAEPIWVTAQKQGKRAASFFWIGSEALIGGMRPADYVKYDDSISLEERVDKVLEWLDRPKEKRPDFITLYASEPDSFGHIHGPCSLEVNQKIATVDGMIHRLFAGIQDRGLLNCVNVIVLADHGMAELSCKRLINLQDYTSEIPEESRFGAYGQIRPESSVESYTDNLYCKNKHMRVYKKEDLPIRFHYVNNKRIEPVFLNLDNGWTVQGNQATYCSGGNHGYDNYYNDMKPFFVATGPSFKVNFTVEPFFNIELYELMCDLLNITARANNGTQGSLHHLLQNHVELPPQPEHPTPPTAFLPNTEDSKERVSAAQCPCTKDHAQTNAVDVESVNRILFPFGMPYSRDYKDMNLLYSDEFVSAYNFAYRMPLWSTFLVPQKVNFNITADTTLCWMGDIRIPKDYTSRCSDYLNIPDNDIVQRPLFSLSFSSSAESLEQALLVTNSMPKYRDHVTLIENAFTWMIYSWYRLRGPLHIVAGPAFNVKNNALKPTLEDIMNSKSNRNSLLLPTHYFYVITWCKMQVDSVNSCNSTQLNVASFLLPNFPLAYNCESPNDLIKFHAARVTDVELLTGISFFTSLPTYDAIRLRTQIPEL